MTRKISVISLLVASALFAMTSERASAQATSAPSTTPIPHVSPSPPPPKTIIPTSALLPTDSSVALCKNGTWIYNPGTAAECAQRGGLLVAMPKRTATLQVMAAAAVVSASVIAPARVALAPPATATMQCKDGTFLYGAPSADRCTNNGGLAAIFTHPTPAPARPSRP